MSQAFPSPPPHNQFFNAPPLPIPAIGDAFTIPSSTNPTGLTVCPMAVYSSPSPIPMHSRVSWRSRVVKPSITAWKSVTDSGPLSGIDSSCMPDIIEAQ